MNLLFDLDDTLYPEKQHIFQGFWAVAQFFQSKYNLDQVQVYLELVSIFRGGSNKVFDDFLQSKNIPENPLYLVDAYRNAKRKLSLYPDVPGNLRVLKSLRNKLILITNGGSETQRKKIKNLGIEKYFNDIFILDDFGKEYWKPSILILDKIYNMYGKKDKYVMIGNADEDLEFAKQAKIDFIFINRRNSVRRIRNTNSLRTIGNLYELIAPLKGGKQNENLFI